MTETPVQEQEEGSQHWVCDFGTKSASEVEVDGELGLLLKGAATRYGEVDGAGEVQTSGALDDISETWAAQAEPLVLYNHGLDHSLWARPIGRGVGCKLSDDGMDVEIFIPRDQYKKWQDKRAIKRFKEVYEGIKSGVIRGLSVGGTFLRVGAKLLRWSTTEVSVTPTPCLPSAVFSLGTKSLVEKFGVLPPGLDEPSNVSQTNLGYIARPDWNKTMGLAHEAGDAGLHDHLLNGYPAEYQGSHNADDCKVCGDRRDMMGIKAAVTKSEGDGSHPKSHYLVATSDNVTDWHLRVRNPDGSPNHTLMGAAWAALHEGYRGNTYQGSNKAEALSKLKALYKSEGMDIPGESSGSGKKVLEHDEEQVDTLIDLMVARPDLFQQATSLLSEVAAGEKAGKRHSKQTLDAVAFVVNHLQNTFGLDKEEDNTNDSSTNDGDD